MSPAAVHDAHKMIDPDQRIKIMIGTECKYEMPRNGFQRGGRWLRWVGQKGDRMGCNIRPHNPTYKYSHNPGSKVMELSYDKGVELSQPYFLDDQGREPTRASSTASYNSGSPLSSGSPSAMMGRTSGSWGHSHHTSLPPPPTLGTSHSSTHTHTHTRTHTHSSTAHSSTAHSPPFDAPTKLAGTQTGSSPPSTAMFDSSTARTSLGSDSQTSSHSTAKFDSSATQWTAGTGSSTPPSTVNFDSSTATIVAGSTRISQGSPPATVSYSDGKASRVSIGSTGSVGSASSSAANSPSVHGVTYQSGSPSATLEFDASQAMVGSSPPNTPPRFEAPVQTTSYIRTSGNITPSFNPPPAISSAECRTMGHHAEAAASTPTKFAPPLEATSPPATYTAQSPGPVGYYSSPGSTM